MMPGKADKPTQNSALQGISEQENFMIRVLFICHGNICRSPMAEYVMKDLVKKSNLSDQFHTSHPLPHPRKRSVTRFIVEHGRSLLRRG